MSQLLKSLRYCVGIGHQSLISTVIPSHDRRDETVKVLKSLINMSQIELWDEDDEEISRELEYKIKSAEETIDFVERVAFQDEDKDMGLIVFYGYIKSVNGKPQKIYHTFPFPAGEDSLSSPENLTCASRRFNLDLLNRNPWFRKEFEEIK